MIGDDDKKEDNPSKLHWWGGALIGGLFGLNSLFDDDEDED